jgi:predicted nucleotidyltransferase
MVAQSDAKKSAISFVEACIQNGIPVKEAILFGSYAKGNADSNSDIDIALIADSFGKNIIQNVKQTALINYKFADIEVHHFHPDELLLDDPFINEIKRTGIEIYPWKA